MPSAAASQQHSHRSTTKIVHKSHRSRHASKSELKDRNKGKVEDGHGNRQTKHQMVMSKLDRRNQAKQRRLNVQANHAQKLSVFGGKDGAPRIIALVPLCSQIESLGTIKKILESGDLDVEDVVVSEGLVKKHIERFRQNVAFIPTSRNLWEVLDACRMADYVLFVIDAAEEVDSFGESLLRSVETQGISNVLACVENLQTIEPSKKRTQTLASIKSYITHFFPALEKVNDLSSRQEGLNVLRTLCTTTPKGIHWREERSWMAVEETQWLTGDDSNQSTSEVILTGVIRGKGLKADRLVAVGDWGDYQISKITAAPTKQNKKARGDNMAVDIEGDGTILEQPTEDVDDLEDLAPEDIAMEDTDQLGTLSVAQSERKGVLIDDHHYYSDDDEQDYETKPKRLPRGTSKYQAAWYLGDIEDSGSDMEDVEDDIEMDAADQVKDYGDGMTDIYMREPTEGGPSEYPQSEAFLDPSPDQEAEQIAEYRSQRRRDAEDDLEFPDEIELPPNVLARERLSRYRGLKNLRTSVWNREEDRLHEPQEWNRLLEVSNYKAARNRMLNETFMGGVAAGTRVHVHLRDVPTSHKQSQSTTVPLAMYSLLRHEHKRTAVNYSITLSNEVEAPIKAKTELLVQCGPRRFLINPLYSLGGQTPNDVHKFKRYIHPGQTAVASFTGPLTWGSIPLLYFTSPATGTPRYIGTGTSLAPSHSRIIAKRIILTGHPFKIHKRSVTIRYMFFNAEDVAWFKALRIWTKRGRSGFVKESLGTHGYFKATFDARINPMDAVAVSLYKRVYPRPAVRWSGAVGEEMKEDGEAPMMVE